LSQHRSLPVEHTLASTPPSCPASVAALELDDALELEEPGCVLEPDPLDEAGPVLELDEPGPVLEFDEPGPVLALDVDVELEPEPDPSR
jgi:hypothetical protein